MPHRNLLCHYLLDLEDDVRIGLLDTHGHEFELQGKETYVSKPIVVYKIA